MIESYMDGGLLYENKLLSSRVNNSKKISQISVSTSKNISHSKKTAKFKKTNFSETTITTIPTKYKSSENFLSSTPLLKFLYGVPLSVSSNTRSHSKQQHLMYYQFLTFIFLFIFHLYCRYFIGGCSYNIFYASYSL